MENALSAVCDWQGLLETITASDCCQTDQPIFYIDNS